MFYVVNMRRILRIPQVSTPDATNGTDGHGVREMCHKERRVGTMVEEDSTCQLSKSLVQHGKDIREQGQRFDAKPPPNTLWCLI